MQSKIMLALAVSLGLSSAPFCLAEDIYLDQGTYLDQDTFVDQEISTNGLFGVDPYGGLTSNDTSWMGTSESQQGRKKGPRGPGGDFHGFALGGSSYQLFQLQMGPPPPPPGPPPGQEDQSYGDSENSQRRPPPPKGGMLMIEGTRYRLENLQFSESSTTDSTYETTSEQTEGAPPKVIGQFQAELVADTGPPSQGVMISEEEALSTESLGTIQGTILQYAPPPRPPRPDSESGQSYQSQETNSERPPPPPHGPQVLEAAVQVDGQSLQLLGLSQKPPKKPGRGGDRGGDRGRGGQGNQGGFSQEYGQE